MPVKLWKYLVTNMYQKLTVVQTYAITSD